MTTSKQYLYGFHALRSRLRSYPESLQAVWLVARKNDKRTLELIALLEKQQIVLHRIQSDEFDTALKAAQLPADCVHQGVLAQLREDLAPRLIQHWDELLSQLDDLTNEASLIVLLDGVTDPHNLGACLRVANAAGATAIVAPRDHSAPLSAAAQKVASGAANDTPYLLVTNLRRAIETLQERNFQVFGLDERGNTTIYTPNLPRRIAFVLGSEGQGLRQLTQESCDQLLSIPMHGTVESVNVSIACALCVFEWRRQQSIPV